MYGLFESIDPDSHSRWQTLAVTAFKYQFMEVDVIKPYSFSVGCLIKIMMDILIKKNSNG